MATCKNCVHYGVCGRRSYIAEYQGGELAHRNNVCCQTFKNKADFVEIPCRCKDCKYYEIHKPSVTLNCERDGRLIPMMPDDYCNYGKRRTN